MERMRVAPGSHDIPVQVRNTFVHFVDDHSAAISRWVTCPGKPEQNKIYLAAICTTVPGEEKEQDWCWGACKRQKEVKMSREQELRLNKTINREITHAASKGDVNSVLDVTWSHLNSMNGVNLATSLHRVARHSIEDETQKGNIQSHPGFDPMMKAIERKARWAVESGQDSNSMEAQSAGFPAQCASIVAWSCATLSVRNDRLFGTLAELVAPRLRELKPYEVTNLVWAFTKLSVPCTHLFQNVATMLQGRRRGEYKAQCLAAAAWSFAKSSSISRSLQSQLFKSIADEILPQVHSLKPQEVVNVVWSFGQMKIKHQRLFEEIAASFLTLSGSSRFSTTQMTNILTAFAQVQFRHAESIGKICGVVLRNSHSLTPEDSSSLLWALAELDVRDRTLLVQKILDMAAADITSFKYQELMVLITAAKTLCPHHRVFFEACEATLGPQFGRDRNGLPGISEDLEYQPGDD